MSSSCRILIGQYEILSRKERVIPDIMPIFREHDRKAYSHTDEDNEVWPVYEYSNTVGHIIQRLNVLGYSLKNIKGDFDANRANIIQELRIDEEEDPDFFKERNAIIIKVLEESSLEDWIEAFRVIRERNLSIIPCWSDREPEKTQSPLVKYVLTEEDYGTFCNFPGGDLLAIFRLFLETCPVETIVKLDISDLIGGGWYGEDQAVCEETLNGLKAGYPTNEKIIVLTEGSSDKYILEESLQLLFPHLAGYYSFMNFADSNAEGGAARLVSLVKSFAGSGISNRVIAIFDNDTAAKSALSPLSRIQLPNNIRVLQYPDIELAKEYPALGPNGVINMDINGLACSIELFLGSDVLVVGAGMTPIQWKGYDSSTKQYQGEILDKSGVQNRFRRKLEIAKKDDSQISAGDWGDLRVLWKFIFQTFQ